MRSTITNGILDVSVDTFGAELVSVRFHGREKLWQGSEWPHHAPILFPVCGNCDLRLDGVEYPIEWHGFARKSEFALCDKRGQSVCFELHASEKTRECYPFEFCFRVMYSLYGASLRIVYEIENLGNGMMYFSCGGHESFALAHPLGEYELRFEKAEVFEHNVHDEEGRLTGETITLGAGTRLPLPAGLLTGGNTLIFKGLRSRKVQLCKTDGNSVAEISFVDFSNLLLWRVGESKMICIEPWHNLPDGPVPIEFSEKDGVVALPPHRKKKFIRSIKYLA